METQTANLTPKIARELGRLMEEFNGKPIPIHLVETRLFFHNFFGNSNSGIRGFSKSYTFNCDQDVFNFFAKIKTFVTEIFIYPNYAENTLYWGSNNLVELQMFFLPHNKECQERIDNRGSKDSIPNKMYKYNYMSFIEGGCTIAVVYNNKRVSFRRNVKYSGAYIRKIMKSSDVFTAFKVE